MYAGGRPDRQASTLNSLWAKAFHLGLAGRRGAVLDVVGRRSGTTVSVPLVPVRFAGALYLGSMLGESNWVRNVRAADGRAVLHYGWRQRPVRLVEVPAENRAPLVRAFLDAAPGARPHVPVERTAPLREIAVVAERIPIFQVVRSD
jgi:hypothetical protein